MIDAIVYVIQTATPFEKPNTTVTVKEPSKKVLVERKYAPDLILAK